MKLNASLESVKTRKNVTDDIIYTVTFNIYPSEDPPAEIGLLTTMYKKPIQITVQEVK